MLQKHEKHLLRQYYHSSSRLVTVAAQVHAARVSGHGPLPSPSNTAAVGHDAGYAISAAAPAAAAPQAVTGTDVDTAAETFCFECSLDKLHEDVPVGQPSLHRLRGQDFSSEQQQLIIAMEKPAYPEGLFTGTIPTGHDKGGKQAIKRCARCAKHAGQCSIRLTQSHKAPKGDDAGCRQWQQNLKTWKAWHDCRGLEYLRHVAHLVRRSDNTIVAEF